MRLERHVPAYIGLGSNLDGPVAQLERALVALAALPRTRLVARSSFYRNPPMGPPGQPHYVNAAAGLLTSLPPLGLLDALLEIEIAQGRRRGGERWGPRTLDLDLLAYGCARLEADALTLPHPGLAERAFVLAPLCEIAPGLRLPGGESIARLAARAGRDGLEVVRR